MFDNKLLLRAKGQIYHCRSGQPAMTYQRISGAWRELEQVPLNLMHSRSLPASW
jgi:hypothetical protein